MTITGTAPVAHPGRRVASAASVWLLVLPVAAWAVLRLGGWERGALVQLFAFTPYVAAAAVLPVLIAALARRWLAAAVGLVALALLAVAVLPRALPDRDPGPAAGTQLRVMTANLLVGGADPTRIVGLVREHGVAVLALQEYTAQAKAALAEAGLTALLPYGAFADEPGTTGSAIYSRYPVTATGARRNGGGFLQAYATVQPPGAAGVLVESAHPLAPAGLEMLSDWHADLAAQPRPDPAGPARILLGDFNATLDHAPLRALISQGYRDAADARGAGLIGTWGPYDGDPIPPVTIDHVLADTRIGVRDAQVFDVARSDHRALLATLTLPAAR